jgi:hypothetical protein
VTNLWITKQLIFQLLLHLVHFVRILFNYLLTIFFKILFLRLKDTCQGDFKEQIENCKIFFSTAPRTAEEKTNPGRILYPVSNPRVKGPIKAFCYTLNTTIPANVTIFQSTRTCIFLIIIRLATTKNFVFS